MKRVIALVLCMMLLLCSCGKSETSNKETQQNATAVPTETVQKVETAKEILSRLTTEQKACQMVQPAVYHMNEDQMEENGYGSMLSTYESMDTSAQGLKTLILSMQDAALKSEAGVPFIYGNDDVHGVNYCEGAVIFPHNIGVGAANDVELTAKMGKAVANEAKLTGMLWNFAPCVATAKDPRWGRTYESYSSDEDIVAKLASAYTKAQSEAGILACGKHFMADGNVKYNTGEGDNIIDRGEATLSEKEMEKQKAIYQSLIDSGCRSIMISHSALNGVKMHANKHMITDVLKGEMKFSGIVVSDWESIHNIGGDSYKDQIITSINAGIDLLMEPEEYETCASLIVEAVNEGSISKGRLDDAVLRILNVKEELGILSDPLMKNLKSDYTETGSEEVCAIARQMVEESLVLVKNDQSLLPLKKGTSIYITGPAANDTGVDCGGWTKTWQGQTDATAGTKYVINGKTILDGFNDLAGDYDLTVITDEKDAKDADVTVLCIGEIPYAEWEGDTKDMSIVGEKALHDNKKAIEAAKKLGKPIVTLIVAGRQPIITDYMDDWDSIVMCYLPGSEANAVANGIVGKSKFQGKLPMPWYKSIKDIGSKKVLFKLGYGLTTK